MTAPTSEARPTLGLSDYLIAALLFVGYTAALLFTTADLGYARDEGFYFQASDTYLRWFKQLLQEPSVAIQQASVDKYWKANHEHPALIKSLFALSRWLLFDTLGVFHERGTSYRFVGMLFGSLSLAVIYVWARQALPAIGGQAKAWLSRGIAATAALSFALIPRVFYHSHLDCFDIPVLSMWLVTTYAYWRSVESNSWRWALATAILYGLLLNTKHNSWLLPFALVAHVLLTKGAVLWRELVAGRVRVPLALVLMATLSPLLFYATWPWIWFDTGSRLAEYVTFHTAHVFYNMEFLGQTYFRPPFPRSYAWLMSAGTIPAVTLALGGVGAAAFGVTWLHRRLLPSIGKLRSVGLRRVVSVLLTVGRRPTNAEQRFDSTCTLWLLCALVSYAPWVSTSSPIFGGTKHWITAYPYICLFAGLGLARLIAAARRNVSPGSLRHGFAPSAVLVCALAAPLSMTIASHPWGLTQYTPLVGGSPGAATLGLNRSFWGYTTGAVQDYINQAAPKRGRVFIHDTAIQSWNMMAKDGRLRSDLRPQLGVAGSVLGVYHHEQHMARVEHQIWVDYGTVRPTQIGAHSGVPVIWIYERKK